MNGCCQTCGKTRRKCCCTLPKFTGQFYGNKKATASSSCAGYQVGDSITTSINQDTIWTTSCFDTSTKLAKELAQIRADRAIRCYDRCYSLICISGELSPGQAAPLRVSNFNGITDFSSDSEVLYTFAVDRWCFPEDKINISGVTSNGIIVLLDTLTPLNPSVELELAGFALVTLQFDNDDVQYSLLDFENVDSERFFIPGLPCTYASNNLVIGQASESTSTPTAIGFISPGPSI